MKRLIVTAVGTVALMAGTAYAGGGCNYGSHADAGEEQSPVLAAAEETDAELLAKLKLKKEMEALEKLIEAPVVHN